MKIVITYGTYDLLHHGHIRLLERAKELGGYLIVGVTSDAFDLSRGKLNVQQSLAERIEAVKATGLADKIIVEEYEGQKIADIKKYGVDIFTVGSDWKGKFDYINEFCDVVYLERTEGVSSTELRTNQNPRIKIGVAGIENPSKRFVNECNCTAEIEVIGAFGEDKDALQSFCHSLKLSMFEDYETLLSQVDAVFISERADRHYDLILRALHADCHVLCNTPLFISESEARECFALAKKKKLVLLDGIKTLFLPAFEHLQLLVSVGVIGTVKDIEVSCSQIPENMNSIKEDAFQGSIYDWGTTALIPIFKILGTNYESCQLYDYEVDNFNYFTKGILKYEHALGTFKVGKGIKSEGDLVITGTKGYIYVPAPWWKTEYFEIRTEDLRDIKKYFYKFEGEGFRYEILEFTRMIHNGLIENYKYTNKEMLQTIKVLEKFKNREVELI